MQTPLPAGHYSTDEAAEILGFTKRELLQRLREIGWLIADKNGVRFGSHNLPKPEVIAAGLAYTKSYTYGSGPGKEFNREYRRAIITQTGLTALIDHFKNGKPAPAFKPLQKLAHEPPTKPTNRKAADAERQAALDALREMGIF